MKVVSLLALLVPLCVGCVFDRSALDERACQTSEDCPGIETCIV